MRDRSVISITLRIIREFEEYSVFGLSGMGGTCSFSLCITNWCGIGNKHTCLLPKHYSAQFKGIIWERTDSKCAKDNSILIWTPLLWYVGTPYCPQGLNHNSNSKKSVDKTQFEFLKYLLEQKTLCPWRSESQFKFKEVSWIKPIRIKWRQPLHRSEHFHCGFVLTRYYPQELTQAENAVPWRSEVQFR